ncbi:MAG: AI-2E family transporter [Xylanivirga thermophila]|jgi:predicted PurR-regulated permease PerM|uniref:AI-2E family transporter n=1 Tax=Xylanivirga thermophila TaxID=2496273 RepID=UPI0039F55159
MQRKIKWGNIVLFLLVIIILGSIIIWKWTKVISVLKIIFYSAALAYILVPLVEPLEKKMPSYLAALVLFITIALVFILFILLFMPILGREFNTFIKNLPKFTLQIQDFIENLQLKFEKIDLPDTLMLSIHQYIQRLQAKIIGGITSFVSNIIDRIMHIGELFMVPIISYYFLKDREHFKEISINILPYKWRPNIIQMVSEIHMVLRQFIRVQLFISLIIGIFSTIGFLIIRLPYALVLGLICGIFEIIPYFGPVLGAIPAAIMSLLSSPQKFVWTIIVVIIVQQLEGNVITPKMMGHHMEIHPVYIILGLWIGGLFFGIGGMFLAIPVMLTLRIILKNLYRSIVSIG